MSRADQSKDCTKPFVEHLDDLRRTILYAAGALIAGLAIVAPLTPRIVDLLRAPMARSELASELPLQVTTVGGSLSVALRVMMLSGILVSLPVIIFIVARFIIPGLTSRERRVLAVAGALATGCFVAGVWMGYRWTLPVALNWMLRIGQWIDTPPRFWETVDYMAFCIKLLMAFGLAFELPVVVLALGRLGIVTSSQLRDKRRHVIVGLCIMAMLLTPQDPFTMLLMAGPLVVLFEGCIWMTWLHERSERRG